jgi:hypothetical protein
MLQFSEWRYTKLWHINVFAWKINYEYADTTWLTHGYSSNLPTVASICDINVLNMNQYEISLSVFVFLSSSS